MRRAIARQKGLLSSKTCCLRTNSSANLSAAVAFYAEYIVSDDMTPAQCRKARDLLDWTAADLARAAGVSVFTVRDFEAGKVAGTRMAPKLLKRALEGAGVRFAASNGGEGAVRLDNRPP